MKIKVLSEETINKIAAGEVIERPASVVKELIENAIDAGASKVDVEAGSGGKSLIRVTDNGSGMNKEDAVLAFERHATSKIDSADDLFKINTLGFRGEALPSIASISKVELVTKTKEMDSAVRIHIEGGKLLEVRETGAPNGTEISIKNLFYNTPARRKFLKTNITELAHIINTISNYALAYEKCGFTLRHNEEEVIKILPKDILLDRIKILFNNETAEGLINLDCEKDGVRIKGFAGKPDMAYPTRANQLVFVNKRPISSRVISYAVFESYKNLIPKGRFPSVFLFLEIAPDAIDVNVHPTKKEVRFGNDRFIQEVIKNAILKALDMKGYTSISNNLEAYNSSVKDIEKKGFSYSSLNSGYEKWGIQEQAVLLDSEKARKAVQMLNSYIILEEENRIEIIDQHAVHERILYEKIKLSLANKSNASQSLLIPINIELTTLEDKILRKEMAFFNKLGFGLEEFGNKTFIVDAIPDFMGKTDVAAFFKEVLNEIKENEKAISQDNVKDGIIKIVACRTAIKQGDKVDAFEIQNLLKEWRQLRFPYTCPHGRPAVINFTKNELDKKFQRT